MSDSTVCGNTADQIYGTGTWTDLGGNCITEVCDSDEDGLFDCVDPCPISADCGLIRVPEDAPDLATPAGFAPDDQPVLIEVAAGTWEFDLASDGLDLTIRGADRATTILTNTSGTAMNGGTDTSIHLERLTLRLPCYFGLKKSEVGQRSHAVVKTR